MYYSQIQTHTVLSRFQENVFAHPYASRGKNADGLFAYARKMRKTEALAYPYINANGPRARKYLPLDIDRAVDLDDFFHIKIPQPNIVIRDRRLARLTFFMNSKSRFTQKPHLTRDRVRLYRFDITIAFEKGSHEF